MRSRLLAEPKDILFYAHLKTCLKKQCFFPMPKPSKNHLFASMEIWPRNSEHMQLFWKSPHRGDFGCRLDSDKTSKMLEIGKRLQTAIQTHGTIAKVWSLEHDKKGILKLIASTSSCLSSRPAGLYQPRTKELWTSAPLRLGGKKTWLLVKGFNMFQWKTWQPAIYWLW